MRLIVEAFIIACLLSLNSCVLGPIAAQQLTTDQMDALKRYNDTGDVYACFLVGGPPPAGNIVAIAVPKGARVEVSFGPDCHGTLKTPQQ